MREILFRGKSTDDDRWVYGSFVIDAREQIQAKNSGEDGFIRGYDEYEKKMVSEEVQRETVCQYTGLTDRRGRKIFEGDIVKHFNNSEDDEKYVIGCIKWDQDSCKFVNEHEDGLQYSIFSKCIYEVIGNIFDNPGMEGEGE